jgi:hypothetical protein
MSPEELLFNVRSRGTEREAREIKKYLGKKYAGRATVSNIRYVRSPSIVPRVRYEIQHNFPQRSDYLKYSGALKELRESMKDKVHSTRITRYPRSLTQRPGEEVVGYSEIITLSAPLAVKMEELRYFSSRMGEILSRFHINDYKRTKVKYRKRQKTK